jgi:uncharacterized membrane protein (DUF106 family)
MTITSFLDPVFKPIMDFIPGPWNLILFSLTLSVAMTLAYKYITNQKMMKELKDEMKIYQNEMKEYKDNPEKMLNLQKKVMEKNMKYMMESFKPTLITMIPVLIIFMWLRGYYMDLGDPKVLFGLSWFWAYFIFTIIFGIALRKLMKVY